MTITHAHSDRHFQLAELRRQIMGIERSAGVGQPAGALAQSVAEMGLAPLFQPLGIDLADDGQNESCLHELVADGYGDQPAVRTFSLALIASLMKHREPLGRESMILWCQRRLDSTEFGYLYGPGLKALGLPPEQFLMVTGKRDADCLWAMEQGLASRSLLAVVGIVDHVDLIASRRLSLAAKTHGIFCFLLPIHQGRDPSAARTRWRIKSAPSTPDHLDPKGLGLPTWHLDLERSPNGRTGHWTLEWDHATHYFHLLTHPGSRPTTSCGSPDKHAGTVTFARTG